MKRLGILVFFVFLAAGCGAKSKPAAAPSNTGGGAASAAASGDEFGAPTEPHSTAPVLLKDLQSGDTACWLVVVDDKGQETDVAAGYVLCPGADHDATKLVGKKVTLAWGHANVPAQSCAGNPDCTKSDSIDVVTSVTPTP